MSTTISGTSGITSANVATTIYQNGTNVGIGTSSPTYGTLEVAQGSNGVVSVINDTAGAWAFRKVRSDGSNGMGIYDATGFGVPAFYASGTERMRIDSSGNLLVGTTSELGAGGLTLQPNYDDGAARITFNRNSTTASSISVVFNNAGVTSGQISYTNTATTYSTSSDYRLKENIQPMQNALGVVQQLNPVTYTWKADGSAGQGFIAHELQAVVPDCVTGEKDAVCTVDVLDDEGRKIGTKEEPVYQGIDTSFLVATLTKAIQEQQAQIETLTAKVAALEAK